MKVTKEYKLTKEQVILIYGYNENEINRIFYSLILISKDFEKFKDEINEYFRGKKDITNFNANEFFNAVKNEACKNDLLELKCMQHLGALLCYLYL